MGKRTRLAAAGALACAALGNGPAQAQADDWRFHAVLYGYLPTISGATAFPNASSPISVNAEDIIDHLKGVFMGNLQVDKGRFGLFNDLLYMDVSGSKSQSRDITIGGLPIPADASANLDMNLKGSIWTIAGTYLASTDAKAPVYLMLGARLLDIKEDLSWQTSGNIGPIPLPGRSGSVSDKASNWDAIVGVKGGFSFGEDGRWIVPYYADVGTGESDLTWQVYAGLGYSFSWGEIVAVWRYLDYNLKSGSAIKDINFNGPAIGIGFRW